MDDSTEQLLEILRIGHETSIRGRGTSLRDAIVRSSYSEFRGTISTSDLFALLKDDEDLTMSWVLYSEDKRTAGGWYVTGSCEIGEVSEPTSKQVFGSLSEAVAEYVLKELDFWTEVDDRRENGTRDAHA